MSSDASRQLVVFSLGDEEHALPIAQVHEIVRWTEPRLLDPQALLGGGAPELAPAA